MLRKLFILWIIIAANISKAELYKQTWYYDSYYPNCQYFDLNNKCTNDPFLGCATNEDVYNIYTNKIFSFTPKNGFKIFGAFDIEKYKEKLIDYLMIKDTIYYRTNALIPASNSIRTSFYRYKPNQPIDSLFSLKFDIGFLGNSYKVDTNYKLINSNGVYSSRKSIELQDISITGKYDSKYIYLDTVNSNYRFIKSFELSNKNTLYTFYEKVNGEDQWKITMLIFDANNKLLKSSSFYSGKIYFTFNSVKCCCDGDNVYFIGNIYQDVTGEAYDVYYKYSLSQDKLLISKEEKLVTKNDFFSVNSFAFFNNKCVAIGSKTQIANLRVYNPQLDSLNYVTSTNDKFYYLVPYENKLYLVGIEDPENMRRYYIKELDLETSGVDESTAQNALDVSPNPASEYVKLSAIAELSETTPILSVYDKKGSRVYSASADFSRDVTLDVSKYANGIYTAVVNDGKTNKIYRFVVNR